MAIVTFRFYAELNNFLAPCFRYQSFRHVCSKDATVKHTIEALGVPHTEVELILVNGACVDFSHKLEDDQRVSVYPHFSSVDIGPMIIVRPALPAEYKFVADAHLGQLAKNLRMLGFDVLYRNDYSDAEVARIAAQENRIVLTRDRDLLIRKEIIHGCYLHAVASEEQVIEVVRRYGLAQSAKAFSRCLNCNGELHHVAKSEVAHRVPQHSRQAYERFFECDGCARVYWEGSHVVRMRHWIEQMLKTSACSVKT